MQFLEPCLATCEMLKEVRSTSRRPRCCDDSFEGRTIRHSK
jgi:hypothetical protein